MAADDCRRKEDGHQGAWYSPRFPLVRLFSIRRLLHAIVHTWFVGWLVDCLVTSFVGWLESFGKINSVSSGPMGIVYWFIQMIWSQNAQTHKMMCYCTSKQKFCILVEAEMSQKLSWRDLFVQIELGIDIASLGIK